MPTYVYRCSACDDTFETFQRITEPALDACPNGHQGTVKRVMQPVAVAFRGEGFHINDYAPKSGGSETKGSETKGSETKTEDKPVEAKAEAKPETPAPAASAEPTP